MDFKDYNLIEYSGLESLFHFDNDFLEYVFKKLNRISLAIFIVTNHIGQEEGIRQDIRKKASSLVLKATELAEGQNSGFTNINTGLKEILSLMIIANNSGLISKNNTYLIKTEIRDLVFKIEDHIKNLNSKIFEVENKRTYLKGQINTNVLNKITHIQKKEIKSIKDNNVVADRSKQIIDIVRDKKTVSIKDITDVIRDCSEKTIQRELKKLVDIGILDKSGERRWSVYSLSLSAKNPL
jgi:hypothetical protein